MAAATAETGAPTRTEIGTLQDAAYLERDLVYLMEFLEKLREHDIWDEVADALDDDDTPALSLATEAVMQRVAQRLRDGYWDHAWWERWLDGETAPPNGTGSSGEGTD